MKKLGWILGMLLLSVAAFSSPAATMPAHAFQGCDEIECNLNNDCTLACSYCDTPSPVFDGECALN